MIQLSSPVNGYPAEAFVEWSIAASTHRRSRAIWYITRRLSDPFLAWLLGGMQTFMIDERKAGDVDGVRRARAFLLKFVGMDACGILTTNYDLLVEYALGTRVFNYGTIGEILAGRGHNPMAPWQNRPVVLRGHVPLAKLHGSVSWDSENRYTDGRCGLKGNALIVPPMAGKCGGDALSDVWGLASNVLGRASHLVVFGFAFNPYDQALLQLLTSAGDAVKKVLLIDPYPAIERARAVWPAAEIFSCPPPLKGTEALPADFYP